MVNPKPALGALVFDAYGTLYDVTSVQAACERAFPGQGAALSSLWRQKQLEYSWLSALMQERTDFWTLTRGALEFACGALGCELSAAARDALLEEYLRLAPFPEVPRALEALGKRLPLAVLSNGTARMLEQVTARSGLKRHFAHLISVDEAGTFKPAPAVYQVAERRLGLARDQIGFISSNSWDATGAKAYGFRVFWINRDARPWERLGHAPDWEIRALNEVLRCLQGLGSGGETASGTG